MKIGRIGKKVSGAAKRAAFKMSKPAPQIMVGLGVVGVVAAGVWACKKSFDLKDSVEEYKDQVDKIDEMLEDPVVDYDPALAKSDKRKLAVHTVATVGKAYAGPVVLGAVSIASILGGHHIEHKRYIGAAAAWAASQADYEALLDRIKRDHGEDEMKRLKYDLQDVVESYSETNENGETVEGVRKYKMASNPPSLYARFFDESCAEWRQDPVHNMMFLKQVEKEANKTLQNRGFITLNEVYQALGLPQNIQYGNEAGWVHGAGDSQVDFGLGDGYDDPAKRAFINGYETVILLDFNCLGRIREYAYRMEGMV